MTRLKCRKTDCSCCAPLPAKYTDPCIYGRPGVPVTDFSEAAFRGPLRGLFLGDLTLGDANPITRRWPLTPREDIPTPSSSSPIGSFDRVPRELLDKILEELDVQTLLNFREVNQTCMSLVDLLLAFQTVAAFPKGLSAVITLRTFSYGIGRLASAMRNTKCSRCNHLGDQLYLITAERLCYPCWRSVPDYFPKKFRKGEVSDELLRKVPHALALPGFYGAHGLTLKNPRLFFHRPSLLAYLGDDDDSDPEVERRTRLWGHWGAANDPRHDTLVNMHLVTIRAPYFDDTTQSFVGGFFCRACATQRYTFEKRELYPDCSWLVGILLFWGNPYRRYTKEGFGAHLREYGEIIKREDGSYAHTAKPSGRYLLWAWEQGWLPFYGASDDIEPEDRPKTDNRTRPWDDELNTVVAPNGDYEEISAGSR
ncbi:F-box domain-containing protein [Colletotrichum musicola]|uniref:F-box domain-containing protein n=1 Tax=Colletotrichum musicola TaxID=2175873 RepID=A0A8H6IVG7_9PEZI|nr:F-box domain-containing protein [Colletotrichum musicola]